MPSTTSSNLGQRIIIEFDTQDEDMVNELARAIESFLSYLPVQTIVRTVADFE